MAAKAERLDVSLVNRGLCDSREQARRLILAGEVRVNDQRADKAARKVSETDRVEVKEKPKYVSRGGLKLEGALQQFGVTPDGMVCADIGASTGGFTDCLLQAGATKVFCFDVGTNQLVYRIRQDERVTAREKFNARYLKPEDIGEPIELAVMDLSFISLTKVLPAVFSVLGESGAVICLIKPQFELNRDEIGKGGIVRDDALRQKAVDKIHQFVLDHEREWKGVIESPITGTDGNQEYLAWIA